MSLYASREGALYQSYDNYAGAQGFYEPQDQGGMPQPPAGLTTQGIDQYAQYYPQQSPQRAIYQEFQDYYRQPELIYQPPPHVEHQMQVVQKTVMMPVVRQQPVVQQAVHPVMQFQPVQYNAELRGVGIKFGEKIDAQTGGMTVYVKRLVRGGPADQSGQISPGDTLLLINSEDVYGLGLDVLRNKIPGPAGTSVRLGFKNAQGRFYEVNLSRTAYGDNQQPQQQQMAMPPQQPPPLPMPQPPQQQFVQQPMVMPQQQQTIMVPQQQMMMQQPQPQVQFMQQPQPQQHIMLVQQQQPQFIQQQPQFMIQQPQPQVQYVVQQQPQFQQQQVQYVMEQPAPVQLQQSPVQQYQQMQPQVQYQQAQPQYQQPAPQQQYQEYQPQQQQQQQYQPQQQQYQQQDWYGQDGVQGTQV